jgi:TET-Associated Glycosyltransferase
MLPVFIASKGRPNGRTMQLLSEQGVSYTAYVEPQDYEAYRASGRTVRKLDANDRGLYYARQWILDDARDRGLPWYWLLDDDISGFYEVLNGRCYPVLAEVALAGSEQLFTDLPTIGMAGLEYRQFAWATSVWYRLNSYCDVCVAIRTSVMADYDQRFKLKGDRDFTIQILMEGYQVMKVSHYAFSAAKNGSNIGGLRETYEAGVEAEMSQLLADKWPGIAEVHTKKDGRPDVKIDWGYFRKKHAS